MAIHFGTSGWRGVISEDFTFGNVRRVSAAALGHVLENAEFGYRNPDYQSTLGGRRGPPLIVVGYDTRFLSEDFAREASEVLAAGGVSVLLASSDVPTPCVAFTILDRKAVGGVTITASHNPFQYNGFKWSPFWAGPATPPITDDLERRAAAVPPAGPALARYDDAVKDGSIKVEDLVPAYRKHLLSLLDRKAFARARLKVGVDCLHGTARRVLRPLLEDLGCEVIALREGRDVLFGGIHPEPSAETLADLQALMRKKRLDLALACDCDADRFGILDPDAGFLQPNEFLGLALYHLVEHRGLQGKAARSLMTSHFLDAVAKAYGLEVRETPVGFKYIGDLLRGGEFLIGGEESGGLSIRGHVPEKDGILACLLAAELRAVERRPLGRVLKDLQRKVGGFVNTRLNFRLDHRDRFLQVAQALEVRPPMKLAGSSVWRIDQTDGFKFLLKDGSWLGLRPSGTEPVVRLYGEAPDAKKLAKLLDEGKKILSGKA